MNSGLFFKDKPIFGLDIGRGSLKVMQLDTRGKTPKVVGFGLATFDPTAMRDGIIVKPEAIAKAANDLFRHHLVGDITTHRVAVAVPIARSFTRAISLPKLARKELVEAIELEIEEYLPEAKEALCMDFASFKESSDKTEVLAVAVTRKIVDSYLLLGRMLGLETVLVRTTIDGAARMFGEDEQSNIPTLLIDFGSLSADISVYDSKTPVVTGIAPGGGDIFTDLIAKKLNINHQEAHIIKTKYGLNVSKKQKQIVEALQPTLAQVVREMRRMIRYYEERYGTERKISQVIAMGGGANMPGLTDYLTSELRLAARSCDPWLYFNANHLQPPNRAERSLYTTVAGLALIKPKDIFV